MILSELTAISPLDGRYRGVTAELSGYFSEFALMRSRVRVEIEYFCALAALPLPELAHVSEASLQPLRAIVASFGLDDAQRIKALEKRVNHDVKAVELFLGERFEELGLGAYRSFIHFGLTSQDVNDTAIPLCLRDALHEVVLPLLRVEVVGKLRELALAWRHIPMLARTHGQPATPTRLGKEIMVFVERLERELGYLEGMEYFGKFGGASGGLNAHYIAYPELDWPAFADAFVRTQLGLSRARHTTQIGHHETLAMVFDGLSRVAGILLDLCQDAWLYIMQGYFVQEFEPCEVGSSAMPHKINPIEFENAEGNLGIAVAMFGHLARKLSVSRLQRDLTDYTVKRNIGVPMAHLSLACRNIVKGLRKVRVNEPRLRADLTANWAVVAEAIQTVLRRTGDASAYERLKALTRGAEVTEESIRHFVAQLELSDELAPLLANLSPLTYLGPSPLE